MYIIIYHIIFQMNMQACKFIVYNEYGCFTDMYTVQCTLYIVQCTLYSVHCTVYIVQCTLYSVYIRYL